MDPYSYVRAATAPDKSLLSLCCGIGLELEFLQTQDVTAVDISDKYTSQVHKRCPQAKVVTMDSLEYIKKQPKDSIDVISIIDGIEHMNKQDGLELIKEMRRVAREKILLFTPQGPGEDGYLKNEPHNAWDIEGADHHQTHKSGWTAEELTDLGFTLVSSATALSQHGEPYTALMFSYELTVPKTLYLYWGGRGLSWLQYLTVVSFKKYNPDWGVVVYYPTNPVLRMDWFSGEQKGGFSGTNYFSKLAGLAELRSFDMTSIDRDDNLPEVHKSDIFRLWVLHQYGGVYCDFDVLFTKPMPEITERTFCHHPDGHYATGLMAAPKGDELFRKLFIATGEIDTLGYQAYGPALWSKELTTEPEGWNIPKNLIYSCDWHKSQDLFTKKKKLPAGAIGVHWYGGSAESSDWANKLTFDNYKEYPSTITEIISCLQ